MALSTTDRFALRTVDNAITINRVLVPTRVRVTSILRVLEERLVKALRGVDVDDSPTRAGRLARIERAIKRFDPLIDRSFADIDARLHRGLRTVGMTASKSATAAVKTILKGSGKPLTQDEVDALVKKQIVQGDTVRNWVRTQRENLRQKMARELRIGVRMGETEAQLVERLRGKSTGRSIEVTLSTGSKRRVRETNGGALQTARNHMDALMRTAASSVTNQVWMDAVRKSGKRIVGWAAVTVLDHRTSDICISRTGAAWFTTGRPTPWSTRNEPFPGPPPWHFHCRSSLAPLTEKNPQLRIKSFDDWLKQRGEAFAREKLGPALYDLWKSGKITLSQLTDQAGQSRTLTQLRQNPRKP